MKKLLMSVAALAAVVVLSSCGGGAPTLELPKDDKTPVFDLGDREAAMKDVTAKDKKDGTITEKVEIAGLEFVGEAGLTYSVENAAGEKTEKKREAIVKGDRLFGKYSVNVIRTYPNGVDPVITYTKPMIAKAHSSDPTKLLLENYEDLDDPVTLHANGTDWLTIPESTSFTQTDSATGVVTTIRVSGKLQYKANNSAKSDYTFYTGSVKFTYEGDPANSYTGEMVITKLDY